MGIFTWTIKTVQDLRAPLQRIVASLTQMTTQVTQALQVLMVRRDESSPYSWC